MTVDTMTLFFALLAILAELGVLILAVLAAGGRIHPAIKRWRDEVFISAGTQAFWLAFLVAAVATAGSLYLSEVAHFVPCRLCWYQRAAMYPLVPALALAASLRRIRARWAVLGVAVVGGAISVWHILIENFPGLESATSCDPANPCSLIWVRRFGYLTIPTMALSGFAMIVALMLIAREPD